MANINDLLGIQQPLNSGLIRNGTFSLGHTGGNILGLLGDALLVGSGKQPMYQPRLDAARAGQALQGFDTDPMGAVQRYAAIDPEKAAALGVKVIDQQNEAADKKFRERYYDDQHRESVIGTNLSLLGTANKDNYPAIKAQIEQNFAKEGIDFPSLPDAYDPLALRSAMAGGIRVKDQFNLFDKDRTADYRDKSLAERTDYHQGLLSQGTARVVEAQRSHEANEGLRGSEISETHRSNIVKEGQGQEKINMDPKNPKNRPTSVKMQDGTIGTVNSAGDRMIQVGPDGQRKIYAKTGMTKDGRRIWSQIG